jgi:hypothetical protein
VLLAGGEAIKVYDEYQRSNDQYKQASTDYGLKLIEYRRELREFMKKSRQTSAGQQPPAPPPEPEWFVTEPQNVFVANLPAGAYSLLLRDEDGTVVEGSEHRLIVFRSAAAKGIGYEIFSEERWTARMTSDTPEAGIYCAAGKQLYLVPYLTEAYFQDQFTRLQNPQFRNPVRRISHIYKNIVENNSLIVLLDKRKVGSSQLKPYYVKQLPGQELGYDIMEWSPEVAGKDSPTFLAFLLDKANLDRGKKLEMALEDQNSAELMPFSRRTLRVTAGSGGLVLWLLPLAPIIVGIAIMISRKRRKALFIIH